ncbi:MAG: signal peptidase II [Candidatus Fraserbacteria bacterium RBG_16_55_9]|uniref:Lipoprotein signal peptidase n=1 Tax=Fraserbacteria sp. (strain RBG_16_55_9) TaxID=1817864 RepID=A0A1F5UPS0_FRAXR|nr:MAG: signal peptidase II [Candidatus Fraserbacteria bacterium RBG_16_55_9]
MNFERRHSSLTPLFWMGVIVAADQLAKLAAATYLEPMRYIPIFGEYFRLTLTWNSGGAFGILAGQGSLLTALTVGVAVTILLVLLRGDLQSKQVVLGLAGIAGGAIGNLIDRLWLGRVVDYLDFGISPTLRWPTFNLADAAIVTGTALLLWRLLARGSTHEGMFHRL